MAYALGALDSLNLRVTNFVLHIAQPGNYNSWAVGKEALYEFGEEVRKACILALEDEGVYGPTDDNCRYCKAQGTCPALHQMTVATVGGDFAVLPDVETLTDEQILSVVKNARLLNSFISSVKDHALTKALHGDAIPGTKAVAGSRRREWVDDAKEKLKEYPELFELRLKGVTAADKVLPKEVMAGLTIKKECKPTIALSGDRRPALQSVKDDFDVIN